ncbi:MAG: TetR/AcrR family transcriptional regulator [Candidatus Aminicenantes bacterium]|nr:TetR/AcrR family transcriptional regulator [Candidatus Aminicenantes bacterium]
MRKPDLSEQRIVETAREIFSRLGFKKTTMEDIARAVFKAKSSLYHYFKSKEEIYRAVVEKESSLVREEIARAMKAALSPIDKLVAYVKTRMRALRRLANLYHAFREEYLESYGFIQKIRRDYDRYEIETIKGILKEGVEKGIFEVTDLDLTAEAIIIAIKGYEYTWAISHDGEKIEREIDRLLNVLFYGILKR